MEDQLRAIKKISPDNASLFVSEALRYYARKVLHANTKVTLTLVTRFQSAAQAYMEWDNAEVKKILERIDAQDLQVLDQLYDGQQQVDWKRIEKKAMADLQNNELTAQVEFTDLENEN